MNNKPSDEARKVARQLVAQEGLASAMVGAERIAEVIATALDQARREQRGLPICPKCQQGYVCEHCGEPIGDYYSER